MGHGIDAGYSRDPVNPNKVEVSALITYGSAIRRSVSFTILFGNAILENDAYRDSMVRRIDLLMDEDPCILRIARPSSALGR